MMISEHVIQDSDDSEHLVGKALAAQPPIVVSVLMLAVGLAMSIKALRQMRKQPRPTFVNRLTRRARHA